MKTVRLNMKAMHRHVAEQHRRIQVGNVYFLSHFHDKEGAMVRVVSKSDRRRNLAGFYSIVNVEVLESDVAYYKPGETHTVNAANLYEHRTMASPEFKFRSK